MLFPADHMLSSVLNEFDKLTADIPDINKEASSGQAIKACLKMLALRERQGSAFINQQIQNLKAVLEKLNQILEQAAADTTAVTDSLSTLSAKLDQFNLNSPLTDLERNWLAIINLFEQSMLTLNQVKSISPRERYQITQLISQWESSDLASQAPSGDSLEAKLEAEPEPPVYDLNYDNLDFYLQKRFQGQTINLVNFRTLPGGYGKETSLFTVEGALSGEFVVRRDYQNQPVSNDCHRVKKEAQVIKAVFNHGLPAPDIAWVDTEHQDLPGGDFIVMHRSPGVTGGDVFGAKTQIADHMVNTLASAAASIHKLPPLDELGNLTTTINPGAWKTSTDEMVFNYLNEWYQLYLGSSHTPSAAIASAYGWLFDHITKVDYSPALLHGDVGFHNMLIHEGDLSALVDWEFAHVGDPAEDLGIIKNSTGDSLNWDKFMAHYSQLTGLEIDPKRVHFFQIWGHVRNATASNMTAAMFADKSTKELKLAYTGCFHMPHFVKKAQQLISTY